MADEITDAIAEQALEPEEAMIDGAMVRQRKIDDMIKAAQFQPGSVPGSAWGGAIRPARVVPPGPTD